MTGYQETLTDPSYAGQIVMMTAPHIGNTGMNDEDTESRRIWVAGFIVRDPSRVVSNCRAERSLDDALVARRHRRHQRHRHARRHPPHPLGRRHARRASSRATPRRSTHGEQLELVPRGAEMAGRTSRRDGLDRRAVRRCRAEGERIGIRRRARPRRQDVDARTTSPRAGSTCTCCRRTSRSRTCCAIEPDRACSSRTAPATRRHPTTTSSCCAACSTTACRSSASASATSCSAARSGFGTYKLPFGHRGINQPVLDKATGRVEITAHNHGFAVDAPIDGRVRLARTASAGSR